MGFSTNADDIARDLAILRADFNNSRSLISGLFVTGTDPDMGFIRAKDALFESYGFAGPIGLQASGTKVLTGTFTALTWTGTLSRLYIGRQLGWSSATNSSRIEILKALSDNVTAIYHFWGEVTFNTASSIGVRRIFLVDPSTVGPALARVPGSSRTITTLPFSMGLNPVTGDSDYRLLVFQDSGSSMQVSGTLYASRIG